MPMMVLCFNWWWGIRWNGCYSGIWCHQLAGWCFWRFLGWIYLKSWHQEVCHCSWIWLWGCSFGPLLRRQLLATWMLTLGSAGRYVLQQWSFTNDIRYDRWRSILNSFPGIADVWEKDECVLIYRNHGRRIKSVTVCINWCIEDVLALFCPP